MNDFLDLDAAAYIHPSAAIYGKVRLHEGSSVWCNAVIRSEAAYVEVGAYSNLQDFVMIHTDPGRPVVIGRNCSVTHHATLHGCTIGDDVLIGINATVYGGAVIGSGSIVGQHAYVKDGTIVPPNSIVVGSPAKVIRTFDSRVPNRVNAAFYHRNALAYARGEHRAWDGPEFDAWMAETIARISAEVAGEAPLG